MGTVFHPPWGRFYNVRPAWNREIDTFAEALAFLRLADGFDGLKKFKIRSGHPSRV
jgi:hypothetical protein